MPVADTMTRSKGHVELSCLQLICLLVIVLISGDLGYSNIYVIILGGP